MLNAGLKQRMHPPASLIHLFGCAATASKVIHGGRGKVTIVTLAEAKLVACR